MANDETWPRELNDFLQKSTRELKFNWNLIAEAVSYFVESNAIRLGIEITAASCRMQFSEGFDHTTFNNKLVDSLSRKETNETYSAVETSDENADQDSISIVQKSFQVSVEGLSLEELVLYVSEKEKQIEERKEILFKRILNSLSADSNSSSELIHDVVTSAYKQTIKAKEDAKRLKEKMEAESEENRRLLIERKKLKDRFAPDSEDQEGENPIPFILQPVTHGKLDSNPEEEIPAPNFEEIIDNDFDALLTELEREYELLAPGKSDGTNFVNEELADVLEILDKAASMKKIPKELPEKVKYDGNQKISADQYVRASPSIATSNINTPVNILSPVVNKREHIPSVDEDSDDRDDDSSSESEGDSEKSDDNLEDWKLSRAAIRSGVNRAASKENASRPEKGSSGIRKAQQVGKRAPTVVVDSSGPKPTLIPPVPPQLFNAEEEMLISPGENPVAEVSHLSHSSSSDVPLRSVDDVNILEGNDEIDSFQEEEVPVLAVKVQSRSGSLLSGSRTMKATRSAGRLPSAKGNAT